MVKCFCFCPFGGPSFTLNNLLLLLPPPAFKSTVFDPRLIIVRLPYINFLALTSRLSKRRKREREREREREKRERGKRDGERDGERELRSMKSMASHVSVLLGLSGEAGSSKVWGRLQGCQGTLVQEMLRSSQPEELRGITKR